MYHVMSGSGSTLKNAKGHVVVKMCLHLKEETLWRFKTINDFTNVDDNKNWMQNNPVHMVTHTNYFFQKFLYYFDKGQDRSLLNR